MKNFKFLLMIWFWVMGILLNAFHGIAQQYDFTLDFEDGNLRGWTSEGRAFRFQPTLDDNPLARGSGQRSNHQGRFWIGTFELYQGLSGQKPGGAQGDGSVGTLTSASFEIPEGTLSFLIGGGSKYETRVELLLEDPIEGSIRVRYATGRDTETMHRESWDLTPYARKRGRIRVVDSSSEGWGHINVDDFQFSTGVATAKKPYSLAADFPKIAAAKEPKISTGPTAKIYPEYREATQGESAEFESQSSPSGAVIREIWTGPSDQTASGKRFTINTMGVAPGAYKIGLTATDRYKRVSRASATLVIVSPPQAPPTGPPMAQPTPQFRVRISVSPNPVENGQSVRFTASLDREIRGAEFNYDFGDNSPDIWIREPEIVHTYPIPGEFYACVTVRGIRTTTERSNIVKIMVTESLPGLTLSLQLDHESPFVEERIIFRAVTSKPLAGARFQFRFGDSIVSDWTVNPEMEHSYGREGTYQAYALVRGDGDKIVESPLVTIQVRTRPQPTYAVQLRPEKTRVQPQTAIAVTAILAPPDNEAEYNFLFGDATESGWQAAREAVHEYARPGEYFVRVLVRKNREIIAESEGTGIAVVQPDQPEKEIRLFLKVTPVFAMTGDPVKFDVSIEPTQQGLEYRIVFGDGNERGWDRDPAAEHVYSQAGSYRPYVTVRVDQRLKTESQPVEVTINAPPQPLLDPTLRTILIIGTAVVIFAAGYLARRIQGRKKHSRTEEPARSFRAEPHMDSGEQFIGSDQRLDLEYELQIRPVVDRGTQEIVVGGPPVADENHESTEEV